MGEKDYCGPKNLEYYDPCKLEVENRKKFLWPPDGVGKPCQCRKYLCTDEAAQRKFHYVPPPKALPIKQPAAFCQTNKPFVASTLYTDSYLPFGTVITEPFRPEDALANCEGKSYYDTTQKKSFPGWYNVSPTKPILPAKSVLSSCGPMETLSTCKKDYTPKPILKSEPCGAQNAISLSDNPLDGRTTSSQAYQDPGIRNVPEAIKPVPAFGRPCGPMEGSTIFKDSYLPWPNQAKEDLPWAGKKPFVPPTVKMENDSTYSKNYQFGGPQPVNEPFKPLPGANPLTSSKEFDDKTQYRENYFNKGHQKPDPIHPSNAFGFSDQKIDGRTTQKESYRDWPDVKPTKAVKPAKSSLSSSGVMENLTTQKKDFTPKPYCKPNLFLTPTSIYNVDKPMETSTTFQSSYKEPDWNQLCKTESFKPDPCVKRSKPFDDRTTHKSEYLSWPKPEKDVLFWTGKTPYIKPTVPMVGKSMYGSTYEPPGVLVEDEARDYCVHGCYCEFPGQCFGTKNPNSIPS